MVKQSDKDKDKDKKKKSNPVFNIEGEALPTDTYAVKCATAKKKLDVIRLYADEFKNILDKSSLYKKPR